jgi:hypothetical protein
MKLLSKKKLILFLSIFAIISGCLNFEEPSKGFTISDEEKILIRKFATENGYPETMVVDSFVRYVYDKWPDEMKKLDYYLTFPKQDAIPRTLVLSDVLSLIGKSLRVHYELAPYGGTVYQAYIDSIEIRTDSIIVLPGLSLSDCNLTHLPAEIGKLRIKALDIGYNSISDLPLEIMQILDPPKYYSYTLIKRDGLHKFHFDSLPDTLKNWFNNVYSKQNFDKN